MARKKRLENVLETKGWKVRLALTGFVVVLFFLMFFLGGGLDFFKPNVAVHNYNDLPFEIHFIDVGLGDSIFMRFPNGETMLIDSGPNEKDNSVVSYLTDLFKHEKLDELDYFILTHPDADHVGKAADIFANFKVNEFYRPKLSSAYEVSINKNPNGYRQVDTKTYDNVLTAAYNEEGCEIYYNEAGLAFYDDNLSIEFLSPNKESYSSNNNYSPIIMVDYAGGKILLTGDAEGVAEREVVELYGEKLKADVIKVGHHGSSTSSSAEFLEYVKPSVAVISVSKDNKYGFPKADTLERLNAVGAEVLTTADRGSIVMSVENGKIVVCNRAKKVIFDIPLLIVCCSMALIIIWGFKIPKKKSDERSKKG